MERSNQMGIRWIEAELHRNRGELLLTGPPPNRTEAEACFCRALAVAQSQGAKLWALRAATALAHLWRDGSRRSEARDVLSVVCSQFAEGIDCPDLSDAKVVLATLH